MQFLIIYVVMTAFIASDELLYAQETDDHKAIRVLIDREQNANDTGDAEALLDVHSEDFIAVWARHYVTTEQRIGFNPGRDMHTMILNGASRQKTGRVVQRY